MNSFTLRATAVLAATLTLGLLAGCAINITPADSTSDNGMGGMMGDSSGDFSMVDLGFAQMMIPHHKQAVEMSDLALEISTDPEIRALATQIRDAQAPEIEQMQSWLDSSTGMMDHDMGTMGGMLSDAEIATLAASTGSEFDRLFLQGMIGHHEGAIQMAQTVLDSNNDEVKALGEAIVSSQTAEIALMRDLLAAR
jgi:uncharacterized protein (DUF305 family)